MNLKDIRLSERSQSQKGKYCTTSPHRSSPLLLQNTLDTPWLPLTKTVSTQRYISGKLQTTGLKWATDSVTVLPALCYLKTAQCPPAPGTVNGKATMVNLTFTKKHLGLLFLNYFKFPMMWRYFKSRHV